LGSSGKQRFGGIPAAERSGRKEKEEKSMIKAIGAVLMSAVFLAFMSGAVMSQATKPDHPAKPDHPKTEQMKPGEMKHEGMKPGEKKPDHPQGQMKPDHPQSPKPDHPKHEHPK